MTLMRIKHLKITLTEAEHADLVRRAGREPLATYARRQLLDLDARPINYDPPPATQRPHRTKAPEPLWKGTKGRLL
jgi:hypothetical protein